MVMFNSRTRTLVLTGLCVCVVITGSSGVGCTTTVSSLDLGCLLQWDCPQANNNTTTYTVQAMTQGVPWQDVEGCVRIPSRQCDASDAFTDFQLYNLFRVGLHEGLGGPVWTDPRSFEPKDFNFSPPTVSVTPSRRGLVAEVHFPCSTSRGQSCRPVSELIDPWVTVSVYNQQNSSDLKVHTGWAQEVVYEAVFLDLLPGQHYCVKANFSFGPPSFLEACSPPSQPHCVHIANPGPGLQPLVVGCVCALLIVPLSAFVLYFLKQRREAPPTDRLPKSLASLQVSVYDLPESSPDPVDPSDVYVELVDDHLSILTSFSGCVDTNNQVPYQGDGYSSNLYHRDYSSDNVHWDTWGTEMDVTFGSTLSLPCSTVTLGLAMNKRNSESPVLLHPGLNGATLAYQGSLGPAEGCVEDHMVPLSSVRFGVASEGEEGENLKGLKWCNL
ncbi:hypothetical protein UPYG_G00238240 [Umbra pygmaea]|uniref:Fibronectin type-III domain-containing protein n=1 Tax=Umbra pygmaea TaxID=75934 RepID=A0ABD0X2K6_UMBPY